MSYRPDPLHEDRGPDRSTMYVKNMFSNWVVRNHPFGYLTARSSSLRECLRVSQAYSLLGVLTLEAQVEAVKKFGHSIELRMMTMMVIDDDSKEVLATG